MEPIIELMLSLLRSSLNKDISSLPPISEKEWEQVYWLARKHGVVTMINDVIEMLPTEQQPHGDIALSWSLSAERTRYHYARQEQVLEKIKQKSKEAGIPLVVLKGMTLSKLYPVPSSRACGDIDIYFPQNYMKGNEILGNPEATLDGKHAEMAIDGVTVENHLHFLDRHYISQRKAERYIKNSLDHISPEGEMEPMANMVYLLMHTVSHLTAKIKLPLRNIVDWGIFLKSYQSQLDPTACNKLMRRIGMVDSFNILTKLASDFIGYDLNHYIIGKLRDEDVQRMRSMILNKDYVGKVPDHLNVFQRLKTRMSRNKQRRWLYRYLPSTPLERIIYRIRSIFIKQPTHE